MTSTFGLVDGKNQLLRTVSTWSAKSRPTPATGRVCPSEPPAKQRYGGEDATLASRGFAVSPASVSVHAWRERRDMLAKLASGANIVRVPPANQASLIGPKP
jgi:hypothetical protein